ncbi:MAG: hypothetical protein GX906_05585 [Clostridiales bacterium]|nr:hypothetical protein [Clostridiales bacterium]
MFLALILLIAFFAVSKISITALAKSPVTVSTSNVGTYTFTGGEQTITGFTVDNDETILQFSNHKFTDVPEGGTLKVTYWAAETTNYDAVPATDFDVTINKATTVIYTDSIERSYTYNSNTRTINSGASTNQVATSSVPVASIQYSNNQFRDVPEGGKKTIVISTLATQNYLAGNATVEITINPFQISGNIINVSKVYGESEGVLDFTIPAGQLLGLDTKEGLGITLGRTPAGNGVGTYTISKNSQTSRNYAVNMPNGTYTISPKPITLVVENKESAYKAPKQSLSVKLDDGHTLVGGDNLEMLKVLYSPINDTYVGEYPITAYQSSEKSPNYTVTFKGSYGDGNQGKGVYKINKISRTLVKSESFVEVFTYNGAQQTAGGVVLSEADPAGDPTLVFVGNKFTDFPGGDGTVTFTVSAAASRNFDAVSATSFTVTLNKRAVTVLIDSKTREYKSNLTGGLTFRISSATPLAPGQLPAVLNVSLESSVIFGSNAGNYPIIASYNNSNYNVTFSGAYGDGNQGKGKYTITKAPMYIIADGKQTIYGTDVNLTYTIDTQTPLKQGDTKEYLNVVFERDEGADVGTYNISYVSGNDTNYAIEVNADAKYRILPKAVNVYIIDKEKVYNAGEEELEYGIDANTPLVYDENISVLKITLTRDIGEMVNVYKINATQGADKSNNYTVTFIGSWGDGTEGKGTYTINKAQLELNISGVEDEYTYTGNLQTVDTGAVLVDEQVGPYQSTIQYSNNTFTTVAEGNGKKVKISIAGNPNYLGDEKEVTLIVTKADTVIYTNTLINEYTYNGAEQTVLGSAVTNHIGVSTTVHFQYDTFTQVPENCPGQNYGTHIVRLYTYANDNYNAGEQDFEITIFKKQSLINIDSVVKEYTYSPAGHEVTGAILNHSEASLVYAGHEITDVPTNCPGEDYGTQLVTVSVSYSRNYTSVSMSFTVKINKAQQTIDTSLIQTSYKSDPSPFPIEIVKDGIYGYATVPDEAQTISYSNNVFQNKEELEANGNVVITAVGNQNYIEVVTTVLLVIDKYVPKFNLDNVTTSFIYTGDIQKIESGVTLDEGTEYQKANITYSNNTFVTVAQGNGKQVTVSVPADGDFIAHSVTFPITVLRADTIITVPEAINYKYNGKEQTAQDFASINHLEGAITYSYNTFTTVAEGNALNILITVAETANYKAASMPNVKINVEKADTEISLALMRTTFTYNGNLQTADGASVNHTENTQITYENNTFTTVSEGNGKEVTIRASATANYKSAVTTTTLTVNKGTYDMSTVGFIDKEVEYNGELHSLTIFGQLPGEEEEITVTYSSNGEINAGTYPISASFEGDSNNYNSIPSLNATLTITKATYDFSNCMFSNKEYTYNGKYQSIVFEGNIPEGYDGSVPKIEYDGSLKNVGSIEITATVSSLSDNYEIKVTEYYATLTISKKGIDVSKTANKRYFSSYENVDTINLTSEYYTISGLCTGDDVDLTYTAEFEDKSAVGKAFIRMLVTAIDNINYELPVMPYEIQIDAAIVYPINLNIITTSFVFDNTPKVMPISAKIAGYDIDENNISIHFRQGNDVMTEAINAGTYTMVVTAIDEYAGVKTEELDMIIERAPSNIILSGNFNQIYTQFEQFAASLQVDADDGTAHRIHISYSFRTSIPVVGTHSVSARFDGSLNYEPSEVSRYFSVSPTKVSISFRENNRYPYTGREQKVEYTLTNQNPDDKDIVLVTYGTNNPIGLGEYGVNYVVNNPNYEIVGVFGPQSIIITKARLEISIKPIVALENKKLEFEFEFKGFVAEDTEGVLKFSPKIDGDTFAAGSYTIVPYGASADNYNIVYKPYNLIVYQENLTTSVGNKGSITVTGHYDSNFELDVKPVAGFDFFDSMFKFSNIIQNAYRVEVVGDGEAPEGTRLIYQDESLKSSILNGAYFINDKGEKTKLAASDLRDGVIETKFAGQSGYIVVYRNYTVVYVIVIVAVATALIILYLTAKTGRRGSPKTKGFRKYR